MSEGLTQRLRELRVRVKEFIDREVIPQEPVIGEGGDAADKAMRRLMEEAKSRGLWALGHPDEIGGGGLPFMDFVYLNEIIGRSEYGRWPSARCRMQDSIMLHLYATEDSSARSCRRSWPATLPVRSASPSPRSPARIRR